MRVVSIDSTEDKSGRIVDLMSASLVNFRSAAMDVRDNNEKHITNSFSLPPTGLTYGYGTDKEGELAYSFTSDNGDLTMFRLVDRNWIKCPVDLEQITVQGAGNEPGQAGLYHRR